MTDQQRPLPENWEWTTIGEITEVVRGGSPRPKGDPKYFGGDIPWIKISDVTRVTGKYISETKDSVTEAGAQKSRYLKAGTLILSNSGTVCVPKILAVDGCIHDGFVAFPDLSDEFDKLYLYYHFEYIRPQIIQQNRQGVTQVNLNTQIVREIPFPLPPLPEQHRIVEAIETQFTRLEAGLAALKQAQARLKRYRAAVLKAACEGRLVPQDPTDEPAAVLLERILAERREQWDGKGKYKEPASPPLGGTEGGRLPDLPEGWVWVTIEQTADQRLGKMLDKAKNKGISRPYLRNLNVRWFGFDLTDMKEIRVTDEELENVSVRAGDLVVCEGGEPGRAAVWVREGESMVIQKALHRVRPYGGISPWYLAYRIAADASTGVLERYFTGSTIKHFTGQSLRSYIFPLPPLAEQQRIVAEVERRLSVVEGVEAAITANLTRGGRLRQAILKKAFAGELVPQNPADEPASVLLERIRGEREGQRTLPGV